MADWAKPTLTSSYANFLSEMAARDTDAVTQFASGTPANLPVGAVRFNRTARKWEAWSGSAWADMASSYAISVTGSAGAVAWSGVSGKPASYPAEAHRHDAAELDNVLATAAAKPLAASATVGSSGKAAREDHAHPLPGVATAGTNGLMASSDKAALDAVPGQVLAAQSAASAAHAAADGKLPLPVALGGGVDLNTLQTVGFYAQSANASATSGANYPSPVAGTLIVQNAGTDITTQIYIAYNTGLMWVRSRYGAAWSAWRQLASTADKVASAGYADSAGSATDQPARDSAWNAQNTANIANNKAQQALDRPPPQINPDTPQSNWNAVGAYVFARGGNELLGPGTTRAGSALDACGAAGTYGKNIGVGTWRLHGYAQGTGSGVNSSTKATVWQRVA